MVAETGMDVADIVRQLQGSANAWDQRKGVDLTEILALSQNEWRDRVALRAFARGPRRTLLAIVNLAGTKSLVWEGKPTQVDKFTFAMAIHNSYPQSMPFVKFMVPVPFNPHVVNLAFLPDDTAGIPAELQAYLRQGSGNMCFLRSEQWNPARDSLAVVIWQVSRILSGRIRAEAASLNQAARDFLLRGEPGFELGPPLPFPCAGRSSAAVPPWEAEGACDVEWLDGESEEADRDA